MVFKRRDTNGNERHQSGVNTENRLPFFQRIRILTGNGLFRKRFKTFLLIGITLSTVFTVQNLIAYSVNNRVTPGFALLQFLNLSFLIHGAVLTSFITGHLYFETKKEMGFRKLLIRSTPVVAVAGVFGYTIAFVLLLPVNMAILGPLNHGDTLRSLIAGILISALFSGLFHFFFLRTAYTTEIPDPIQADENGKQAKGLFIKQEGEKIYIPFRSIHYIAAHGKQAVLHTEKGDYLVSKLLNHLLEALPHDLFLRVHKSYIVSLEAVRGRETASGGRNFLLLNDEDDTRIPIGRSYGDAVRHKLGN